MVRASGSPQGREAFDADNVILATGAHRVPRTPTFAGDLSDDIVQLHSADYRNPGQLEPGTVLLVGAGNTGAEIAMDVAPTHQVLMAGRTVGEIPIDIRGWQGRLIFPVLWWVWEHILTERTKPGRKVQAEASRRARAIRGSGRRRRTSSRPVSSAPPGSREWSTAGPGTRTARCSTSRT